LRLRPRGRRAPPGRKGRGGTGAPRPPCQIGSWPAARLRPFLVKIFGEMGWATKWGMARHLIWDQCRGDRAIDPARHGQPGRLSPADSVALRSFQWLPVGSWKEVSDGADGAQELVRAALR
jgi:hypothetical protein